MEKEREILMAKSCYGHLGGTLGNRLFERMVKLNWFESDGERRFRITKVGQEQLLKLGVDIFT